MVVILFGSSFILFNATAFSGDPLEGLRTSTDPNAAMLIKQLTRELHLDVPPPLRYFIWLRGILGIFTGNLDLGNTRMATSVVEELAVAIPTTLRLVTVATVTAMVLGIAIGIITALRQYSRFDYAMTFVSFLLFSLPIFWVAVLLKQYLAISFNDFLADPVISTTFIVGAAVVSGLFWGALLGSNRKRAWSVFGIAGLASGLLLAVMSATRWFADPYLGPVLVAIFAVGIAYGITQISMGIGHKPSLYASLTMAGIGILLYFPMQTVFDWPNRRYLWPALFLLTIGVGVLVGLAWARIDRGPVIRTSVLTGVLVSGLILFDKLLRTFGPFMKDPAINGRPIPTSGQVTILLDRSNFWFSFLDILIHLILPTVALTLISFAGYVRFARGTLLEVLNQDYIRTARSKGLPERTVIMRHAFRNTLIPLTTIMVVDFAGIIGGAIITENVFAWSGMGTLARMAIANFDLNLLMGVFFITSGLTVMANLVADLLYSALDPRIRVAGGK